MKGMLINLLCLLLVGFKVCGGARLLPENNHLFTLPQNPSAFDPNLNIVMPSAGSSDPDSRDLADKTVVPCDESTEMSASAEIATDQDDKNKLTFRLNENRTGVDAKKESPQPGHSSNASAEVQRLSGSTPSPAVGHMQISQIAKSSQSDAASVTQKRVLDGSTPSPGGGH